MELIILDVGVALTGTVLGFYLLSLFDLPLPIVVQVFLMGLQRYFPSCSTWDVNQTELHIISWWMHMDELVFMRVNTQSHFQYSLALISTKTSICTILICYPYHIP